MTKEALTLAACALACSCSAAVTPEKPVAPEQTATPERTPMTAAALPETRRQLEVELLYLDLTTCGRCVGTAQNLEAAIAEVSSLLGAAGVDVSLRKVHVTTADLARRHRFTSSPTIRVDGQDVALEQRESACRDCTELGGCGGGIDCRVWVWQGREHTEAPKGLIVDALLRAAYGPPRPASAPGPYELPENLRRFYEATAAKPAPQSEACCARTCCAPGAGESRGAGR